MADLTVRDPSAGSPAAGSGGGAGARRRGWRFWAVELVLMVAGYLFYAHARDLHGQSLTARDQRIARRHGFDLLHLEHSLGLDWERGLQNALLRFRLFMKIIGGFYGGAHFVVTFGVLLFLLFRRPDRYGFWRTSLFVTTMTAVTIFVLYPAFPPRLMPAAVKTQDTLDTIGGLWSYNRGVLEHISDPYAPMPSLHLGWATWSAMALWFCLPATRRRVKLLLLAYPTLVYFTVISTGTHWTIDGVAGMATFAAATGATFVVYKRFHLFDRRDPQRYSPSGRGR